MLKKIFLIFLTACPVPALMAQDQPPGGIVIKPRPAEETMLALADFQPKSGETGLSLEENLKTINETLWSDLEYAGFFKLLSKSLQPARRLVEPEDLDFNEWQNAGQPVDFIVMGNARLDNNYVVVQCRVYDVKTKEQVFGKQFRTIPLYTRGIAHRIADHIVSLLSANASRGIASTQIVFEQKTRTGKEIMVMDYDGGNPQPLTSNGSINLTPVFSSGSDRICFTSYMQGSPLLYELTLSSGKLQALPVKGGLITTPAYTPDGKGLAFAGRLENSSDTDIYHYLFDGGTLRNITQNPGIDVSPCWSPTGRQLAFVSNRQGIPQVFISDLFGADLQCITQEGGYASSPDWSPDGRYIVFHWKPARMANFDLYLVEVATRKIFQLTRGAGNNENPSWAPDGRHLVFQSDRSGTSQIFTIFADGTELRRLTEGLGASNPDWSGYNLNN